MNAWFRFYHEVLDDPKVQTLTLYQFKFWVNCLCLASRNNGFLPSLVDVSFAFRETFEGVSQTSTELVKLGLLDETKRGLTPHGWRKRQFKSDGSTERVKRFRKRSSSVSATLHETGPEQIQNRTDTDTEQTPPIVPQKTSEPKLRLGEYGHVFLSENEYAKLNAKMNGKLVFYIERFDNFVQEAPEASSSGVKRKNRNAYFTIDNWFRMDSERKPNERGKTKTERTAEAAQRLLNRLDKDSRGSC